MGALGSSQCVVRMDFLDSVVRDSTDPPPPSRSRFPLAFESHLVLHLATYRCSRSEGVSIDCERVRDGARFSCRYCARAQHSRATRSWRGPRRADPNSTPDDVGGGAACVRDSEKPRVGKLAACKDRGREVAGGAFPFSAACLGRQARRVLFRVHCGRLRVRGRENARQHDQRGDCSDARSQNNFYEDY